MKRRPPPRFGREAVRGDLVVVGEGDRAPADATVLQAGISGPTHCY